MKKTLTALLICSASFLFGQAEQQDEGMNHWSIGVNVGGSDGHAPIRMGRPKVYQPHMVQGNLRYMFNNRFGIMGTLMYNNFKIGETGYRTNYMSAQIHGVVNAADLLKLNTIADNRIGLLIHGGFGLASMWQKGFFDSLGIENPESPLFNKADDMLVWSFGATPQFRITDNFTLNADLTFNFHGRQSRTFDFQHANNRSGIDGYFLNVSVGASYSFGKAKRHADWIPTEYGGEEVDMSSYEAKVKELEERIAKAEKNAEDAKLADRDGDGVPDDYDLCPDKEGPWGFSGCPDTDGDGIPDHLDECPDVYGSWKYKGCPTISKEIKEVLDKALKGVNFETGRAVLTADSYPALDEVVRIMKEDKTYKLKITGHTDNVGTPEHNMKLSKDRAQAVEDYLESKGLEAERFIVIGFGETRPIASNDTKAGKAKNRRVEFTIVF